MDAPSVKSAAVSAGVTLAGAFTFYPDMVVSGVVGGLAAILTIEELTKWQRVKCMVTAVLVSFFIGPVALHVLPRVFPDLLNGVDEYALRIATGFALGFLAYKVLLPGALRRIKKEIGE